MIIIGDYSDNRRRFSGGARSISVISAFASDIRRIARIPR
jgi:hypothetical protein